MALCITWMTSASTRNVAVSDQLRAVAVIFCAGVEMSSDSIRVNGQGPAMHDTRALRNSFPVPASSVTDPIVAFHLPSGEQGAWWSQDTLPAFFTSNAFTALPTFIVRGA